MKVRASVTVFISVVMSVLIAFSGVMVDLSRLRTGEKQARAAVQLSVQSALSQYHAPLKEKYGLMAMGLGQQELELMIGELLEKNLGVDTRYMSGYTDLYGFEVEKVTVTPMFNLTEDYVLEQQITQFMKYRAPVATIGSFVEKLRSLNTCMAQSGLINNKMELEKKLQKIREEQVYLRLLLIERIKGFSTRNKPGDALQEKLDSMHEACDEILRLEAPQGQLDIAWKRLPELAAKISGARGNLNSLESRLTSLEDRLTAGKKEKDDLQHSIDSADRSVEKLKAQNKTLLEDVEKEKRKKTPNVSRIAAKEAEVAANEELLESHEKNISSWEAAKRSISDNLSDISRDIASVEADIREEKAAIEKEAAALQAETDQCLQILHEMREKTDSLMNQAAQTQGMVQKYCRYHEEAIKLIDASKKGCEEAQALTAQIKAEIDKQTSQADNAFLTRIKADIQKLINNADPAALGAIRTELCANLVSLEPAASQAGSSFEQISETLNRLDHLIEKVKKLPQSCQSFEREEFGTGADNSVKAMSGGIAEAAANYKKPEYGVEPKVNTKEKNEFYKWCNSVFGEDNQTDTGRDKNKQSKLKQSIKKTDAENKEQQKAFQGSDEKLDNKELEKLFKTLPSWRDKNGSYPNVVNSEYMPEASEDASILPESEENGNVDIEENYSHALNQNAGFANIIGKALANAGESLLKSLYVNEFIVTAFKNANMDTDSRSLLLYGRQAGETFYEKAEAEYILFGCKREKTNANLAQTSIFGIRMGLNLIHVYTNTDKQASALTAATALAGWTGFGVPVVKNLILIGWAAGESWLDVKDINQGKQVAVYKTQNSWKTDLKSLFSGVADELMKDSAKWLKQTASDGVTTADKALQEAVTDIVASAVHEAFLPLEQAVSELGEAGEESAEPDAGVLRAPVQISSMEDLRAWITDMAQKQFEAMKRQVKDYTGVRLEDCKKKIQEQILKFLFESQAYKGFVEKIRGGLNEVINSGTEKIGDAIHKLGDKIGDKGTTDQLVGTVVSFDYTDYLRLLLFVVPQKTKLLRCADLMQLNLQKMLDNPELLMKDYHSFVIVEAEISMRFLFLPEKLLKKDSGLLKVRWGYGY